MTHPAPTPDSNLPPTPTHRPPDPNPDPPDAPLTRTPTQTPDLIILILILVLILVLVLILTLILILILAHNRVVCLSGREQPHAIVAPWLHPHERMTKLARWDSDLHAEIVAILIARLQIVPGCGSRGSGVALGLGAVT